MILIYDADQVTTADHEGDSGQQLDLVIGMGSERALTKAHQEAFNNGVPLVVVLGKDALEWPSLRKIGSSARHAVRQATIRLTLLDADTMNRCLGTDDFRAIDESVHASLPELVRRAHSVWERPVMVFHAPYEIPATANAASRVRPRKMREAFRKTHRVVDLSGSPKDRAKAFRDLRMLVKKGLKPEFAYSENSTQPNLLASPIGDGIIVGLEAKIFRFFNKAGIPFGQFYRDVYWKFPEKTGGRSGLKAKIFDAAYRHDLKILESERAHVFLPSLPMVQYLPELSRVSELPPGSEPVQSAHPESLKFFYVGGLGPHYRLHLLVRAMAEHSEASLTVCVPEHNWEAMRSEYEPLPVNVRVVHGSGAQLEEYYDEANVGVLLVEPDDYWKFAVPLKFFEYQAHGKAVAATDGTYAGELVKRYEIGEAIEYTSEAIHDLLVRWQKDTQLIRKFADNARDERSQHTWDARARTVERTLKGS